MSNADDSNYTCSKLFSSVPFYSPDGIHYYPSPSAQAISTTQPYASPQSGTIAPAYDVTKGLPVFVADGGSIGPLNLTGSFAPSTSSGASYLGISYNSACGTAQNMVSIQPATVTADSV